MLGRHFLVSELRNACSLGRVLDSDGSNATEGIEVEEGVLVQVSGLNDRHILELDVQSVGVREVANLHGVNLPNRRIRTTNFAINTSSGSATACELGRSPASRTASLHRTHNFGYQSTLLRPTSVPRRCEPGAFPLFAAAKRRIESRISANHGALRRRRSGSSTRPGEAPAPARLEPADLAPSCATSTH